MNDFPVPVVVFSKCLGFAHCRYNGMIIDDAEVERLKPHLRCLPVCPECELGLGVPREPVRLVGEKERPRLFQPATGEDYTEEMEDFAKKFALSLSEVDGFLFKERSPSCGIKGVKYYRNEQDRGSSGTTRGIFAREVLRISPYVPVEEEGRLRNLKLREHFLTRLFALARLREAVDRGRMRDLVDFHSRHKLMLMAYNQKELRSLGKIVANQERRSIGDIFYLYSHGFQRALDRLPRLTAHLNVLMHALGYFSERLEKREKAFFLETLDSYRQEKISLSVAIALIQSWMVRFQQPYLSTQNYFNPFPIDLVGLSDSGKGRNV